MSFLNWLESTGFSTWVREGESLLAFPTILTLHTFGLGVLVGAATIVNLRLLGAARSLGVASLGPLFSLMWVGFYVNLVTGSMLFAAQATERGSSLFFLTKMLFVALGVWMTVLLGRAVRATPHGAPPAASTKRLAMVSMAAWTVAVMCGRLLAYV